LTDYPNLEGFKKAVTEILNFGNHLLYKRQLASGVFREVKKLQEIGRLLQEASRLAESGKSKLRFQALYLGVYEIADQYFCEKRVELARKHGELETEEMRLGKGAHEALTEGFPTIQQEEVEEDYQRRRSYTKHATHSQMERRYYFRKTRHSLL